MTEFSDSRLVADIEALARFSLPGDGVTRLAWTTELRDAYAWAAELCAEIGMRSEVDAAGNFLARWEEGSGAALLVGSHIDSVPQGGRFDGSLGFLAGLDAIRRLKAQGFQPRRPIWLIAFMDEENTRFNAALFGSRSFCGEDMTDLGDRQDADGTSLAEAIASWGMDISDAPKAHRVDRVGRFVELHVEQGPRLEDSGTQIGVVTSIVGIVGYRALVRGQANHAGTTPMNLRRDALAGASRMVLAIREMGRQIPTATSNVGVISAGPGSSNVIPGTCSFTIDLRAGDEPTIAGLDARCVRELTEIAGEEELEIDLEETYRVRAVPMSAEVIEAIEAAAADESVSFERMPSGAGHDAMVLARYVPTGMIFVPSRGGISHSPEEFTTPADAECGARVLARALSRLAS